MPSAVVAQDENGELAYYDAWFEDRLSHFRESRSSDGPDHDKLTLLIDPTFGEMTLLIAEIRPPYVFEGPGFVSQFRGYAHIKAIFSSSEYEQILDAGAMGRMERKFETAKIVTPDEVDMVTGVTEHRHEIIDTYVANMPEEELDDFFLKLAPGKLSSMVECYPENGCTDGTQMFVELLRENERVFLTRHNCDATYKEDFAIFEPLFRTAIRKMPDLEAKFRSVWKAETGRALD